MARVFIDGFESGETNLWDADSGCSITTPVKTGMSGTYCLYCVSDYVEKDISSASSYYLALKSCHMNASQGRCLEFRLDGNIQVKLARDSSSECYNLYQGSSSLLATGNIKIQIGTTYLVEIYILVANTGGRCIVKINGVTDIDFTGDTQALSSDQMNRLRLGSDQYTSFYADDIVIDDSDWIGETKIEALIPTGAGTTTQWSPSVGANWETVDETPASDADYNFVNAVDQIDTFATKDMTGDVGNVKCVQAQARALKKGSTTPQNFALAIRSGGTNYFSADHEVPTVSDDFIKLWEKNPNGTVAWTKTSVNAMEIGYKSKT